MPVPPSYNMTNIPNDVPLFLAYGGKDALSVQEDVKLLLDSLHQHEQVKLVIQYTENYAHADFVMGFNARQVVYDPAMAFLKLHRQKLGYRFMLGVTDSHNVLCYVCSL
ncbi:Triacylglycerol lipase 2 [Sesamum angolense]|uniref:Triacylglycerol lipase 2 n=1 Tax=Sesamum angolense TaxID=2727404 RepID=A0AAE1WQU7_9LAMI|nr:Triacylglycerol lipase 2 [Sesamum angolense]